MALSSFRSSQESHAHSRQTLDVLYEHDDFMESVGRVADLGAGPDALDAIWWATATTRDDTPQPLNIQTIAIDQFDTFLPAKKNKNLSYQKADLETWCEAKRGFDVLWCHDTFQYMINPLQCLSNWWHVTADNGMLVLILPQTTNMEFNNEAFDLPAGCYYNHTLVSLIYMLATTGWDCGSGFFRKQPGDPWLHAVVYRSRQQPRDPRRTTWYDLVESGLLPDSAAKSINKYGYLRQRDLILPWLDKSFRWMGKQ
jgi:SAM-dependent methyltransferase